MSEGSADEPFRAEYAKSGRSSCKACKMPIEKAELRLAVMVQVQTRRGPTECSAVSTFSRLPVSDV